MTIAFTLGRYFKELNFRKNRCKNIYFAILTNAKNTPDEVNLALVRMQNSGSIISIDIC
jgi:hypothetical protein